MLLTISRIFFLLKLTDLKVFRIDLDSEPQEFVLHILLSVRVNEQMHILQVVIFFPEIRFAYPNMHFATI